MRTLTAQESALLAQRDYVVHARVEVDRTGGGVWQDLDALGGPGGWVLSVDHEGGVDNPVDTLSVTTLRERGPLSLSPYRQTSPLNQYGGIYVPLIDIGRRIRLWTAMTPHATPPSAADWRHQFDGYIDTIDPGADRPEIAIKCRDLGALLQDTFIEETRVYSTDVEPYTPVETVMQQILDDNLGAGVVTLYTPSSPSWNITKYQQAKEPVLDALRKLAQQIGWDVRYKWRAASNAFVLTFYQPDRTKVAIDRTFQPGEVRSYGRAALDRANIRNRIRVICGPEDARVNVVVADASSQARYGLRYMEVTEAASSQINTAGEATTMANAILADLKDPSIEGEETSRQCYAVELGDLYRFTADGTHFDSTQDLAVLSYRHSLGRGSPQTTITVRGKPAMSYRLWLSLGARAGIAPSVDLTPPAQPAGVVLTPGLASIGVSYTAPTDPDWERSECHVSTVSGFAPGPTTLRAQGKVSSFLVGGLATNTVYYVQVVAYDRSGNKSTPSVQASTTTLRATTPDLSPGAVTPEKVNKNLAPRNLGKNQYLEP